MTTLEDVKVLGLNSAIFADMEDGEAAGDDMPDVDVAEEDEEDEDGNGDDVDSDE